MIECNLFRISNVKDKKIYSLMNYIHLWSSTCGMLHFSCLLNDIGIASYETKHHVIVQEIMSVF